MLYQDSTILCFSALKSANAKLEMAVSGKDSEKMKLSGRVSELEADLVSCQKSLFEKERSLEQRQNDLSTTKQTLEDTQAKVWAGFKLGIEKLGSWEPTTFGEWVLS